MRATMQVVACSILDHEIVRVKMDGVILDSYPSMVSQTILDAMVVLLHSNAINVRDVEVELDNEKVLIIVDLHY